MGEVSHVQVDRSGRIEIPEAMRLRLGLRPGTTVELETSGADEIRLRAAVAGPQIVDEGGTLVIDSPVVDGVDPERLVEEEREHRVSELIERLAHRWHRRVDLLPYPPSSRCRGRWAGSRRGGRAPASLAQGLFTTRPGVFPRLRT